ncbi:hypothetical protein KPL47_22600 [Clostridium estertheticum]|uniref:hypothetical protein n=1 Tax=Clostridium estertheticum TaxID=238834 RepID=UPI001C0D4450|nr:hypothetical protein [Clostridium estertheticum]MBU3179089.1 hypothetical protein [Clostridium estertheticum]
MKGKIIWLIELFIYIIIVVVGIVLLFTFKPEKKAIEIPADFKIVERGESSAFVYIK